MDPLQTAVLVVATIVLFGGGVVVVHRELTAPGRRKVGVVRDLVEVLLPIGGLIALIAIAWSSLQS